MPDLDTRRQHEAAIIVLLMQDFEQYQGRELGNAVQRDLAPELASVFDEAANKLEPSVPMDRISGRATAYASQWSGFVGVGISEALPEELTRERAEKIAATEVTRAITAGEAAAILLIAALTGQTFRPIWHTERDALVCPVCFPLHGTGMEIYGAVSSAGPPAHPNCRCWLDYQGDV